MRDAPTAIKVRQTEGILEVTWGNAAPARILLYALRCACQCAACVDEHTGAKTLDDATVPADVSVTDMQLVGNYAVRFTFTDGHDTGIYSWDHLYGMPNVE